MNVKNIFFWIRLVAELILEVFPGNRPPDGEPGDGPGNGKDFGHPSPQMKPERIQIWLRILARAALEAIDAVVVPEDDGDGTGEEMKPERIQFWVGFVALFVLSVIAGVSEETGKSGERAGEPASRSSNGS